MLLALWPGCKGNLVDDLRMDVRFPKSPAVSWAALIMCTARQQHSVCGIPTFTSTYVQCVSLAGKCRVRGGCECKHDKVDLWLLTILQDLALAVYCCVIAS